MLLKLRSNSNRLFLLLILLVFSFCSSEPTQEEIQAQIDAAVELAVEEALANSSIEESTTTTTASTTTTIPASEGDSVDVQPEDIPDSALPGRRIDGEISTFGASYDQARKGKIRNAYIAPGITRSNGITYDAFVINIETNSEKNLLPGPYLVWKGGNPCVTDEGGCKVPDEFEEYLRIRGSFVGYDYNEQKPTWKPEIITNQDSKLVGKFYGTFEGESDFLLKIEPGASFRSYRLPDSIIIEVEKITPLTFTNIKKTLHGQIFQGFVENVIPNEETGSYQVLIDDEIYAEITSDTAIYFNGIKVDKYDFKADKSEYVHAVFNSGVTKSIPAQGTASAIYIKNVGNTSGFVNSATLNDIEYHQNDRVRRILVNEDMYVRITSETKIYLNGIKVDSYNFNSEKSEYVYVEHGLVQLSLPGQTFGEAIYIVSD